jgi:hypothetical protein
MEQLPGPQTSLMYTKAFALDANIKYGENAGSKKMKLLV